MMAGVGSPLSGPAAGGGLSVGQERCGLQWVNWACVGWRDGGSKSSGEVLRSTVGCDTHVPCRWDGVRRAGGDAACWDCWPAPLGIKSVARGSWR